ncbi:MAG: hypothetical protein AABX32_01475 [Nanoarchaeota archaeon]
MKIVIPDYKITPVESALEKSLGKIHLDEPSVFMRFDPSIHPAIEREAKYGDFEATYRRWLEVDSIKGIKPRMPFSELVRYLNNPRTYSENVTLRGDNLSIDMLFQRGKLTSLTEPTAEQLAGAISLFYNINVPPEAFAFSDVNLRDAEASDLSDRLIRAKTRLAEAAVQIMALPQDQRFNAKKSTLETVSREENIPAEILLDAMQTYGHGVKLSEIGHIVDAFEVQGPFLEFLAKNGFTPKPADIVTMFVNYSIRQE